MQTPNIKSTKIQSTDVQQKGQPKGVAAPDGGASFQALLEKLESRADGLSGRVVDEPSQLSGAVTEARDSLNAALDLGRDLLEAYREARLGKAS